jgi:hypothetical protein
VGRTQSFGISHGPHRPGPRQPQQPRQRRQRPPPPGIVPTWPTPPRLVSSIATSVEHGHNEAHGWNPTDGSLKGPCNYMKDRPTEFTRAQRAAKTCPDVQGAANASKRRPVSFLLQRPTAH